MQKILDTTKIHVPPKQPTAEGLDRATYEQTRKIYRHTGAILDHLSNPPEGSDDPLEQLYMALLQIDHRLSRIEKRLGVDSQPQD